MTDSPVELPIEEYGEFPPGTIVLAKLKSFPPWPGIVIPNELIPTGIFKSKPKKVNSVRKGRGRKVQKVSNEEEKLWCVRFLRDDTFMWATKNDVSILTKDQIKSFLDKNKKTKKTIKGAYEMALNPPDLEEFIIYGSDGKPIQVDNEADDADFNEDEIEEDDDEDEEEGEEDDEEEDEDSEEEAVSTPRKKRNNTPVQKKRGRPSVKKKIQDPDSSGDEDWEDDIYDNVESIAVDIPSSKELSNEIKSYASSIKKLKSQLLSIFIPLVNDEELSVNSKDLKNLTTLFDNLFEDNDLPISLIKHIGLNKIIFNILKQPFFTKRKDLLKFREKLENLVKDLYGLNIEVDENWTYEEPEEPEPALAEEIKEEDIEMKDEEVKEEEVKDEEEKEKNESLPLV